MNALSIPLKVPGTTTRPASRYVMGSRRKKILIVDDDAVILKAMSMKLQAQGYAVTTAIDASAAISAVRDDRPDLILLDINFPPDVANGGRVAWDGFQIMSWVRNLEEAKDIPFILLTGTDSPEYRRRSIAHRAVALFHKPIDHRDLLQVINKTLIEHKTAVFVESGPTSAEPSTGKSTQTTSGELVINEPPARLAVAPVPQPKADPHAPGLLDECARVFVLNLRLLGKLLVAFWKW